MTLNTKPRICLIYTGGTIGMQRDKDGTLHPPEHPDTFLDIAPELKDLVVIDLVGLMNKDSTNMKPLDWTAIARAIYERRQSGFEGFVVAHGTDTMHFSASAVAFALGRNLNFPVVFTGAQTAPDVPHGDARVNLIRACQVATMDLAEVAICFGDYVFRGCRAQKKDERRFDAFESPAFFPLAYITEKIVLAPLAKRRSADRPPIRFSPHFAAGVFQASLIPGIEPELLRPVLRSPACRGIILQSFGAGNVPNEGDYSFEDFIHEAVRREKPLIITSQFPANETLHTVYAPGKAAVQAGGIPTGNMTSSCAAAKFRWVLAQVEASGKTGKEKMRAIKEKMQKVFIGEMGDVDIANGQRHKN